MPYPNDEAEDLILRDHLALDRTVLANERTLLSYVRTGLFLFVSGVTLAKVFADSVALVVLGIVVMALSAGVIAFGIWRFRSTHRKIAQARRPKEVSSAVATGVEVAGAAKREQEAVG